jgi:hypothetical protein
MKGKDLPKGKYFTHRSVTPIIIGRSVNGMFVYFSYLKGEQITYEKDILWDDITIEQIDYPTTLQLLIDVAVKDNPTVPEVEPQWTTLKELKDGQWFIGKHGSVGKVFGDIIVYLNDYAPYWGNKNELGSLEVNPVNRHQALLQAITLLVNDYQEG